MLLQNCDLQNIHPGRKYDWPFVITDIKFPLLGTDFLAHHGLLADVGRKRLLDTGTCRSRPLSTGLYAPSLRTSTAPSSTSSETSSSQSCISCQEPRPNTASITISPQQARLHAKFRRLPPKKLQDAKRAFTKMEQMGICRKASSLWASLPPHGKETRRLLEALWGLPSAEPSNDTGPLSLADMQDLTGALHGAKVFTKMDLLKSYFQVPVHPDDVLKTAIITPLGTYTFYSTFGLGNARATFQHLMDTILGDLPFYVCYVDDILIFSRSQEEHLRHVLAVLKRLQENGLVVRFDKCISRAEKVDFLGHEISPARVRPMASKVDAVKKCQRQKPSSPYRSSSAWSTTTTASYQMSPALCIPDHSPEGEAKSTGVGSSATTGIRAEDGSPRQSHHINTSRPHHLPETYHRCQQHRLRSGAGAGVRGLPTPAGLLQSQVNTARDPLQCI